MHLCLVLYGCYPGLLVLELRLQLAFIPGISGNSPDLLHGLCLSQSKLTHAFLCSSTNLRAHTVWRLWLVEAWAAEWSFLELALAWIGPVSGAGGACEHRIGSS